MMTKYGKLFEQVTFSNGAKAKNRFMLAPMCDDSAEEDFYNCLIQLWKEN